MAKIKSILVEGQGYYHAQEKEPDNYLGQPYFLEIYPSFSATVNDHGFVCLDYDGVMTKVVNARYVVEVNFYID